MNRRNAFIDTSIFYVPNMDELKRFTRDNGGAFVMGIVTIPSPTKESFLNVDSVSYSGKNTVLSFHTTSGYMIGTNDYSDANKLKQSIEAIVNKIRCLSCSKGYFE